MSSNRNFGIVFFVVLFVVGIFPLLKGNDPIYWLIFISFIFLILGIFNSKILTPLNKSWTKFGEVLGKIIAPIVMGIVYFLILTPTSILTKLFGKDLLGIKFNSKKKTYWKLREKNIGSMKKQF